MTKPSNKHPLHSRLVELEATTRLWIAANEAKDQRIKELETECAHLRNRIARLSRQVGRHRTASSTARVRHAK
jgi:hypothetical protein